MSRSLSTRWLAQGARREPWTRALLVTCLLFLFLVGIRGMGTGFMGLGNNLLDSFFSATTNPFVGLCIGLLGTTLVQSSSVTTSMIVALVAAPSDPLPIANAIPMIMGANIGTTVTNTVVALGHIGRPGEFQRAFSAATCHDFFNFMAVGVLLPLELATGILQRSSHWLSNQLVGTSVGGNLPNPVKHAAKAVVDPMNAALHGMLPSAAWASGTLTLLSVLLIFLCLTFIVRNLRSLTATTLKTYVTRSLEANPMIGLIVGVVVTVMVQSSSITTSVLIPLAGAGLVSLRQVFPITLGANIGTTLTALLASTAAPSETAQLAIQIALVHLLFNLMGILLIYPLEAVREVPLRLAERLASVAVHSKKAALLYVLGLFYGLPAALVLVSRWW